MFFDKQAESKINSLVFNGLADHTHHVKKVMCRFCGPSMLELWHAIDIKDFSSFRSFVVITGGDIYDVDFLSRHEILPPMSVQKLPIDCENWSRVYKNQLIITNREEFCSKMMTPDAVVALPTYRFDFLVDDVKYELENGLTIIHALEKVLKSPLTGYSYKTFCRFDDSPHPQDVFNLLDSIVPVDM